MSSSPGLVLLINLVSFVMFGYAIFYMNFDPKSLQMHKISPIPKYGHLKFLTYQCLLFQFVNSVLHIGAFIAPRVLTKPRDLFFTCLAYPVGSIVVYTFWAVWHLVGREFIFPVVLSQFYPDWLNHVTHTIIAPLNLLLLMMVKYQYSKRGSMLTLLYFMLYVGLLHFIKFETGLFVYKYLEEMNDMQRVIYFAATAAGALMFYKSGQVLSGLFHKQATVASKKPKQK